MKRIPKFWILLLGHFLFGVTVYGQVCDVPLSALQSVSQWVVEAKVLSKKEFWNPAQTKIYTQYEVEVADYLIGSGPQNLSLVLRGGCIEDHCQIVIPELKLGLGTRGILFFETLHPGAPFHP